MRVDGRIIERIEEDSVKGPLTAAQKQIIARDFNVPVSRVESLYTFYSPGNGENRICTGLSCKMKRRSVTYASSSLQDMKEESCLGYCDHAPVLKVGGKFVTDGEKGMAEIEESKEEYVTARRETLPVYIERGGYSGLEKILDGEDPASLTRILEKVNMRGMGGAGFPVLAKRDSFAQNNHGESILLVNAHEGEPGTFKDRSIMELNPHRVIEGALLCAISNGIPKIVIGLKKEYSLASGSLKNAIGEMKRKFSNVQIPEIEVLEVSGTYVTGEETALMEAIEGARSEPRLRPPFPTERGLYGKPTVVHNVETLAVISDLVRSPEASIVKKYCLSGDVNKPGIYSEKLGVTVKDLLQNHGHTSLDRIKALMPGGLSGGILPGSNLDLKLDFESVRAAGAGLGTGAMIVLSDDSCTVDATRNVMDFFKNESCGKCLPCRYGTVELKDVMHHLSEGTATHDELEKAKETAGAMIDGSICALGQAAGKVFLDELRNFEGEVKDHLDGKCAAGICDSGGYSS